jgi:predicted Zn-dependent protease
LNNIGGKVIFFRGLMDLLSDNDAQIASVMAHEISHALLRHHSEQQGFASILNSLAFVVRGIFGIRITGDRAVLALGMMLPYSRRAEREADIVGLFLMARACYNPRRAIVTFQKMGQNKKVRNSYFSTHPADEERIELFRKNMTTAEEERRRFCGERNNAAYGEQVSIWYEGLSGKVKTK